MVIYVALPWCPMLRVSITILYLLVCMPALAQSVAMRPGHARIISSNVTDDTATTADYDGWIVWKSPVAGSKIQQLSHCNSTASGRSIGVVDEQYNASVYAIDIGAVDSTIGGVSGFTIDSNGGSALFVCDGVNNWMTVMHSSGFSVRTQTLSNDEIQARDSGGLVIYTGAGDVSVSLPSSMSSSPNAFAGGHFMVHIRNSRSGQAIITPLDPSRINGAASLVIPGGGSATIFAGTDRNYYTQ